MKDACISTIRRDEVRRDHDRNVLLVCNEGANTHDQSIHSIQVGVRANPCGIESTIDQ